MQGVLVFASAAARDAAITSPQEVQFAYLKDTNVTTYYTGSAWANLDTTGMTNPMTTTGDTIYSSSGSTPARLGIGTSGQVLTVSGGGVPSWATPAGGGGGKVLQVIQGTTTTATTIASTSFTDTSLTATITPTLSTSKILVITTQQFFYTRNTAGIGISAKLLRDATVVYSAGNNGYETAFIQGPAGTYYVRGVYSLNYLDSPATTSATTYKVQAAVNDTSSGGTSTFQEGSTQSNIILLEIGA
jgi:hypothetical protein